MGIKEKLKSGLLWLVGFVIYFLLYWKLYGLIAFQLLSLSLAWLNVLDMLAISVFLLSAVPASYGIRQLLFKLIKRHD